LVLFLIKSGFDKALISPVSSLFSFIKIIEEPVRNTSGFSSKKLNCFSKRSGKQRSSASIRAMYLPRAFEMPMFRFSTKPLNPLFIGFSYKIRSEERRVGKEYISQI